MVSLQMTIMVQTRYSNIRARFLPSVQALADAVVEFVDFAAMGVLADKCSAAAALTFELLSRQECSRYDVVSMMSRMESIAQEISPARLSPSDLPFDFESPKPMVACVSLSQNTTNPFDASNDHRFILIYSQGRVKLMQAYNDVMSMRKFEETHGARFTWSSMEAFSEWWAKLSSRAHGDKTVGSWEQLIGIEYGRDAPASAFVVDAVIL
jgi:hypothetical protein